MKAKSKVKTKKQCLLNEILEKEFLASTIVRFKLYTPVVTQKALPGQFVVIRVDEYAERIPMTIVDFDREAGSLVIILQVVVLMRDFLG